MIYVFFFYQELTSFGKVYLNFYDAKLTLENEATKCLCCFILYVKLFNVTVFIVVVLDNIINVYFM